MNYESPYAGMIGRQMRLSELQRELQSRNNAWSQVQANTTPLGVGMTVMSSIGGTNTFVANGNGAWINSATAASAGAQSGRSGGSIRFQNLPVTCYSFETGSDLTSVRYWIGIGLSPFTTTDDPSGSGDFFGLRFSSTASDTGWFAFTADLSTTTMTGFNTGVTVTASTRYDVALINYSSTQAYAYIGTGADQPMAGPFPLAWPAGIVTNTAYSMFVGCEAVAASARAIRFGRGWYSRR